MCPHVFQMVLVRFAKCGFDGLAKSRKSILRLPYGRRKRAIFLALCGVAGSHILLFEMRASQAPGCVWV